jgi:hypothetical protein
MSFLGGAGRASDGDHDLNREPVSAYHEGRRSTATDRLCGGTLACDRCDAPIDPGREPISLGQNLTCPFCRRHAPARDFLSLASPTRPARVAVRISRRRPRAA